MSGSAAGLLRANPDFQLLWWGQALSALGSSMNGVALPLLVLHLTGSAAATGATVTVRLLALNVVRLPGGVLADRWDRRRVMICTDLIKAILWVIPAVMVVAGARMLWPLLAVAVMDGLVSSIYNPSLGAAIRHLVKPDQILHAVSLNQARSYAAGLIGPAVGGVLFTLAAAAPFVADSATFFLCAFLTTRIGKGFGGAVSARAGIVTEIWLGLRYVAAQPFLRIQTLWSALVNFATAAAFFGLIPILHDAGVRGGVIGLWSSVIAGAGFLGALGAPRLNEHRPFQALLVCGVMVTMSAVFIAATQTVPTVIGGLVLISIIGPALSVLLSSHIYRIVPDELLGRTQSSMTTIGSLIYPFAAIVMGFVLQNFGVGAGYGMVAICLACCAVLCLPGPIRMQVDTRRQRATEGTVVNAT